ncbi:MAG: hypothetical protein O3B01_16395 [Planctomycetota bacterium]|nr:hypothetical protein [Planctomycetota bacterium]MDA1140155.1 hypothetical protein [Planctomycetota bacterium]
MRSLLFACSIFSLSLIMGPLSAEEHKHNEGEAVFDGEIVDLQCYMTNPKESTGEKHAKCAASCIQRGKPAGFLSKGKLYLLLAEGKGSIARMAAEHAGKDVEIHGKVIDLGGMKAIQVEAIKVEHDHDGHKHKD